jgi:adenine deaminase
MPTVYELAEQTYPGVTFDSALPQDWVNAMQARGFDVRGHFVTLYPKDALAYMAPITPEGIRMAAIVASYPA